jgi:hypothetical protein
MLIRNEDDGSAIAIGQASHAWLSGQLARAWGNERFGAVEPWEEVCLGAEQHDLGWAMWDIRPTLNPDSGLPYTFIELPIQPKLDLWSGAATRLVSQSRYAALLVSMHGTALYERFWPEGADPALQQEFLSSEGAFQGELTASLGAGRDQVRRNQRLIWAWDSLSLGLCLRWPATELHEVPAADGLRSIELLPLGDGRAELDPWPFARDSVRVRAEGRRLGGRYGSDAELRAALADAPWVTLEFELASRTRG